MLRFMRLTEPRALWNAVLKIRTTNGPNGRTRDLEPVGAVRRRDHESPAWSNPLKRIISARLTARESAFDSAAQLRHNTLNRAR